MTFDWLDKSKSTKHKSVCHVSEVSGVVGAAVGRTAVEPVACKSNTADQPD